MKKQSWLLGLFVLTLICCVKTAGAPSKPGLWTQPTAGIDVKPIFHASLELRWKGKVLLFDPSFEPAYSSEVETPGIILITDIHGDHLDTAILGRIAKPGIPIVAPKAVYDLLPAHLKQQTKVLANAEKFSWKDIEIEAIAMYNLADAKQMYHEKGRGNGYIVHLGGKKVYISGDTEDTPEMRGLKNIDLAFVCMNLPYTMDINRAAKGVLAFQPLVVIPYHYRGDSAVSDTKAFKNLVQRGNKAIKVDLLDFYPKLP